MLFTNPQKLVKHIQLMDILLYLTLDGNLIFLFNLFLKLFYKILFTNFLGVSTTQKSLGMIWHIALACLLNWQSTLILCCPMVRNTTIFYIFSDTYIRIMSFQNDVKYWRFGFVIFFTFWNLRQPQGIIRVP